MSLQTPMFACQKSGACNARVTRKRMQLVHLRSLILLHPLLRLFRVHLNSSIRRANVSRIWVCSCSVVAANSSACIHRNTCRRHFMPTYRGIAHFAILSGSLYCGCHEPGEMISYLSCGLKWCIWHWQDANCPLLCNCTGTYPYLSHWTGRTFWQLFIAMMDAWKQYLLIVERAVVTRALQQLLRLTMQVNRSVILVLLRQRWRD